jgi:hypothetical protein
VKVLAQSELAQDRLSPSHKSNARKQAFVTAPIIVGPIILGAAAVLFLAIRIYFWPGHDIISATSGKGLAGFFQSFIPERVSSFVHGLTYGVAVEVVGHKRLAEEEIIRLLPLDNSKFWWKFNCADLKSSVMQHPLIKSASVTPVSWASVSNYRVKIVERKARAMLKTDDGRWLLVSDGGYVIGSIESQKVLAGLIQKFSSGQPLPIPVVLGVEVPGISVGQHHSRLAYAVASISRLKISSSKNESSREMPYGEIKPRVIKMVPSGELEVVFEGYSYPVRFSNASANPELLTNEFKRLRTVLESIGHDTSISSVDLAFKKVAVVRREKVEASTSSK